MTKQAYVDIAACIVEEAVPLMRTAGLRIVGSEHSSRPSTVRLRIEGERLPAACEDDGLIGVNIVWRTVTEGEKRIAHLAAINVLHEHMVIEVPVVTPEDTARPRRSPHPALR
jgi:hypothetical protein